MKVRGEKGVGFQVGEQARRFISGARAGRVPQRDPTVWAWWWTLRRAASKGARDTTPRSTPAAATGSSSARATSRTPTTRPTVGRARTRSGSRCAAALPTGCRPPLRWCGYGATTKQPPTYSMCCGSSAATGWNDYGGSGAYVNVDTSGCGWTDGPDADRIRPPPPYYFASLSDTSCGTRIGDGCAALASGVNSIYSAIATGFRVYVKPASTFWTQAAKAKDNNWRINWCGIKALPPSSGAGAKAGFPCKSLPLSLRHASGLSTACAIVTGIIGFTSHVSAIAID